jgi:hypothetical protein
VVDGDGPPVVHPERLSSLSESVRFPLRKLRQLSDISSSSIVHHIAHLVHYSSLRDSFIDLQWICVV